MPAGAVSGLLNSPRSNPSKPDTPQMADNRLSISGLLKMRLSDPRQSDVLKYDHIVPPVVTDVDWL